MHKLIILLAFPSIIYNIRTFTPYFNDKVALTYEFHYHQHHMIFLMNIFEKSMFAANMSVDSVHFGFPGAWRRGNMVCDRFQSYGTIN